MFRLFFLLVCLGSTAIAQTLNQAEVHMNYKKHAALTQLHRWYQYYENNEVPIANQLDILCKNVRIDSALGQSNGHDDYQQRVSQLPKTWQNAHFIKQPTFNFDQADGLGLEIGITYLNVGVLADKAVRSASVNYQTTLQFDDGLLPKFSLIDIKSSDDRADAPSAYKDAYAENRLKSVLHYWLTIIEHPNRDPQPAKEILAESFVLNFSSGSITDFDGFIEWFKGPASSVTASAHHLKNFAYKTLSENHYELQVDMDWQGVLPDQSELMAQTRHIWRVVDDPHNRFAKIESIDVEILTPFQPLIRKKATEKSAE